MKSILGMTTGLCHARLPTPILVQAGLPTSPDVQYLSPMPPQRPKLLWQRPIDVTVCWVSCTSGTSHTQVARGDLGAPCDEEKETISRSTNIRNGHSMKLPSREEPFFQNSPRRCRIPMGSWRSLIRDSRLALLFPVQDWDWLSGDAVGAEGSAVMRCDWWRK